VSLQSLNIHLSYNSGDDDILKDFYIPCFKHSNEYKRAVGFFTSGILIALSSGINVFLLNGGTIKLICSPLLSLEDIGAIQKGYENKNTIIQNALSREIERLPKDIFDDNLNCLSWLIANNKLEIKIALPKFFSCEDYGIYHEKMGIFTDEFDNKIVFHGSNNETISGVKYNYESFDVYKSWVDESRCILKDGHFARLWNGEAHGIEIWFIRLMRTFNT